jgi:voltage-gated potassium channel Kch
VTVAADVGAVFAAEHRAQPAPGEPMRLAIEPSDERLLFVGWNPIAPTLLAEFDRFAAVGSTAVVLVDDAVLSAEEVVVPATTNIEVSVLVGNDPTVPLRDPGVTAVVLLAYTERLAPADADGRTLLDLSLVQRAVATRMSPAPQLFVQLLDDERSVLAEMPGLDGFRISDGLGSEMIAQLAVVPERQDVFRRLYDPDRASLHLVDLERLGIDAPATFGNVVAAAYASGALAIGWLTSPERGRRPVLSPPLTADVDRSDQIVVVG